uniref:Uncharacterized protein n=1 Tax=Meloidogyne floridensis TaxID=298350 RepID=A0A915NN61_9BILA
MKEQTNEQEFAPLSKQNCLPVYEPSTSQEVLQSSNSSLPINNRNSLYHSLPLYWPKGWRTYGPSTQTNSFHQSSLNPEPSFTASTSPLIDNEQETNTRQQRKIFSLNRHQKISNNDTTSKGWRRKRRKEFNFVDIRPKETQIWLLNNFELERKHKRSIGEEDKINSKSVFGLARLCGFNCTVNLKHGIDDNNSGESKISSQVLRITLKRVEQDEKEGIGKRKRRSTASDNQNWNPLSPFLLVQTMDSDNHTQISRSHISPACFYIAKIDDGNCFESSIVNLCDRNNGL